MCVFKDGPKTDPYIGNPFCYRGTTVPKTFDPRAADAANEIKIQLYFDEYSFDVVLPHQPECFVSGAVTNYCTYMIQK